jgi:hypothetical protein
MALVAGSTVRITFTEGSNRPDDKRLHQLEAEGIGLRRSEGFGRVVFNHPAHTVHTGEFTGFAATVTIPDALPEKTVGTAHDEDFSASWKAHVKDQMAHSGKDLDDKIKQVMARRLMETRNDPHVLIAEPADKPNGENSTEKKETKDAYEKYRDAAKFVRDTLKKLDDEQQPLQNRRIAYIILAEALMK